MTTKEFEIEVNKHRKELQRLRKKIDATWREVKRNAERNLKETD